jgi:predicted nucleic acid-binding protein
MPGAVLDTGVLIRHLRNRPGFKALLSRLADEGDLIIASFTRLEVVRGMRDHERDRTLLLLNSLVTHPLDAATADRAGLLIRSALARGRTAAGPDAVIAATALMAGAVLVTTNPRHFVFPELDVRAVDERGTFAP